MANATPDAPQERQMVMNGAIIPCDRIDPRQSSRSVWASFRPPSAAKPKPVHATTTLLGLYLGVQVSERQHRTGDVFDRGNALQHLE